MKHITKISTLLIALTLAMSASAATKYCETPVTSTIGQTGENLILTAEKTGDKETTFTLYSETSQFTSMFDVALQLVPTNVTETDWKAGWTLADNKMTKVVTWVTVPEAIQLYIVAKRDNSSGGSDLIGATFSDIDPSASCSGEPDSGDDSGSTTIPIGPSGIDWNTIPTWVNENGFAAHREQFKAQAGCGTVHYIQDNQQKLCIYVAFGKAIKECNVDHFKNGGQLFLWLSALSNRETEIIVTFTDDTSCSFWILNAKAEPADDPDQPVEEGVCTYEGGPGDGLTAQPGKDLFETGYEVTLQLDNTLKNILVTATTKDRPATSAIFQNYYTFIEKEANNEQYMDGGNTSTFTKTIPVSWIKNSADGIIRFAIKFEYPDGVIKVTTPEFFYLDGSGCAQRVFAIYHHDDLPAEPLEGEDQFTEFAGGKILQSIQYKRRMPSEVWETLSVPFDVDSVTAFDPATGKHVRLYAQYNNGSTQAGHYWLRYFKTPSVTRDNFQSNWHDIEVDNQDAAKPVKDKAYIIRLPNGGGYYNDKYIVFHGRGYQEIAKAYIAPALPQDDYYSYSGNNTMMPQDLYSAYVLDNAGYYFTSSSTVTLPPFECSVNATAATIAKMPRIALNGRNNTTTDLTLLPTTDLQGGVIYSIFGAAVARFNTIDEYDQVCQTLAAGVYVIVTPSTTTKIQIP